MPIVIYGVGSRMVGEVAETCGRLKFQIAAWIRNFDGQVFVPEFATVTDANDIPAELLECEVAVPQFTPADRQAAFKEAQLKGFSEAATLVDPTAIIASSARISAGSYINSMANIGAASRIGSFAFINRGASIGHDTDLAEFVSIGPAAVLTGGVRIGCGTVVGAGAVVLPNLEIGQNAVIGAGAIVTRSVPPRSIVMGNPARVVEKGISGYNGRGVEL